MRYLSMRKLLNALRSPITLLFAAMAITFILYYPGLAGPFLLDDFVNIQLAQVDSLTLHSIADMLLSGDARPASRPLSYLIFT